MLDVRRLRLLRELAHRGTIAAVADALSFSPSAVSQQLSVLEREAGVPLLERTGQLAVALVHESDFVPREADPGLAGEALFTEPMYLAALGEGPQAVADHRHSPWITSPPGTLCHTMAVRACQAAGFSPRIRHQ